MGGSADPADVRLGVEFHPELSPLGQDWMEINTYADSMAEPQDLARIRQHFQREGSTQKKIRTCQRLGVRRLHI